MAIHDSPHPPVPLTGLSITERLFQGLETRRDAAVVIDGHVVAIQSGQAKADGTVSVNGVEIARKTLAFPLQVELGWRRPPQVVVAAS